MRLVAPAIEEVIPDNLSVTAGPGALDHKHALAQRGQEHEWSEEHNAYIVWAIMHCIDESCGYAELQEWDDESHSDDLVNVATMTKACKGPWTFPTRIDGET